MARINELYEKIASRIVSQMADGVLPWHRPWSVNPNARVSKPLRENAVPYRGINVLILWGAAIDAGYASPFWMTYRQAQSIRAQVRKGERATHIVFAKTAKKRERDETGEEVEAIIPVRRVYAVFNADQIDGLPEQYVPEIPDVNPDQRDAACQAWFDSLDIEIRYGGQRAYYAPGPDRVQMPPFETFESTAHFLSTLAHEMTHATGHKDRLDRLRGRIDDRARGARGARGGARLGIPVRGSRHRLESPRGPRELHRLVARTAHRRAARGVRRRDPGAAGGRVPARAARGQRRRGCAIPGSRGRVGSRPRLPARTAPRDRSPLRLPSIPVSLVRAAARQGRRPQAVGRRWRGR